MHQNCMYAPKHEFGVQWGGSGVFIAKNSDSTSWHELLHQFGPFCTEIRNSTKRSPNAPKLFEMHLNMSLWSNGMDRMLSFRKILMRLRATNFCTCSARFAPNSVRQPNGPKCTQVVRNTPKRQFRIQWGGSGVFLQEIRTQLHDTDFCTSSARFAPSFTRQPSIPKCIQIVSNALNT